jgi:hypothetical protein
VKRVLLERLAEAVAPPAAVGAGTPVGVSGPSDVVHVALCWMRKAAHSALSDS